MSLPAQIQPDDVKYLAELLGDCQTEQIDLFLETQGGLTYGAESIISLLREKTHDLRVIVPNCAKSNGTLISLASKGIVMGINSQLGPFDPLININGQMVPAHYVLRLDANTHPLEWQSAETAVRQSANIARRLLKNHLSEEKHDLIESIVDALSTKSQFPDHATVINAKDALALGLNVDYLPPENSLWKKFWFLYCMYDYDSSLKGLAKIFEGKRVSSSIMP
jgi:ClpP class serine protease